MMFPDYQTDASVVRAAAESHGRPLAPGWLEWQKLCEKIQLRGALPIRCILARRPEIYVRFIMRVPDIDAALRLKDPEDAPYIEIEQIHPAPDWIKEPKERLRWFEATFQRMYHHEIREQLFIGEERPLAPHEDHG